MSTLPDHPVELAALVDYQDGSVVSNTLVKDAAGTVTAFAFDAGEELSEHSTPFDALVQILDGAAVITIAGTEHEVATNHVLRLPANVPHAVRAEQRFKMLLTMIRGRPSD